jgi:capsid protein
MTPKANFIDRLLEFVSPSTAVRRLKAREMLTEFRYEGAMSSRDRQLVGMHETLSSESHSSARDRVQLMAEARDLMQNSPLVRGLIMELATYTFGTIRYQARTGDAKRDAQYEEAWEFWCRQCDLSGRHNFASLVRLAFIAMLRDGDCGFVKRMSGSEFRIQLIEGDRIGRPHENWLTNTDELDSYFSGVIVNPKTGEPKGYRVYRRTREGLYVDPIDVPANQFRHIFDPLRIDQYRGITVLDTAIPTCRDIHDILRYEKFAVKWNSSNTAIIEKQGGEPDEWATTTDSKGNHVEEVNYGTINYLQAGESIKPFQTARPNATFEMFIEQLERQVCLALQIPYGFFVNSKDSGGVTGRLDSQKARRACARYQQLITDAVLEPLKNDFMAWAISNNIIKAVKTWRIGRWQFSAWPTADIGRESTANIEEHKLGLKTASDIFAEQGKDWEEEFEQLAREQQTLDRLSKEYGIPVDRLSQRNPNPTQEDQTEKPAAPQVAVKKKEPKQAFNELWDRHVTEFNCGTGAGGFKQGNTCSAGGEGKGAKSKSGSLGQDGSKVRGGLPHTVVDSKRGIVKLEKDPIPHFVVVEKQRKTKTVKGKDGKPREVFEVNRTLADGKPLPPWAKLAPGITNVTISTEPENPKAKWKMTGESVYKRGVSMDRQTDQTVSANQGSNFKEVEKLVARIPKIQEQLNKDATQTRDYDRADAAECALAMIATGARPGSVGASRKKESPTSKKQRSESKTGGAKDYDGPTYGVTTWEARHIERLGPSRAKITYVPGKKHGEQVSHTVSGFVAESLLQRKSQCESPTERLFNTTESGLNLYFKSVGVKKAKNIRTATACNIAGKAIEKIGKSKTFSSDREMKRAKLEVAKLASDQIGNTPQMALGKYIDPNLFSGWKVK